MKKLLISLLVIIVLVFAGMPYYLGLKAEESLNAQQQMLSQSGVLTVESYQYERGWFGATETMVVRLKPALFHNTQKYLPDNIKTLLKEPVTIVNHIKHGPFAAGISPVRAYVETEFQYHPDTEKVLTRFFGKQPPVQMSNTVYLNGSGKLDMAIPAFDYEELSGIKLNWQGLTGTVDYQADFASYIQDYLIPAINIKLADKGDIAMENLHVRADTADSSNQLALGSSSLTLDKFSMQWQEGFDYNVKANELVNLVTDLQIGAFINPTGTVPPSKVEVEKLSFNTDTQEVDGWVNSKGRFQFQTLVYGEDRYGPLDINVAAEHLDAQGLLAIKNKMAELATQEMTEEQVQNEILKTVKNEAAGLFTKNPVLKLETFHFTMPQGDVDVKGEVRFNGLTQADMDDITALVKKIDAEFDMKVPQKLLEDLAVTQARSLFSVNPEDLAAGRASMDDINETLQLMVESTIRSMAGEQYLTLDQGNIQTKIELEQGQLKLNGKVFETEPEPEFTDADMVPEVAASAP
ncbi:YdgA family protein [Neisseria montereyensis]|uniref:YdgA family protein n=1 Tax=Neisseria montereyensis TaxID=2973938 RepID=A0ABT2FAW4_9NEIS|nr:YdgA family protein [Neisseria montereyensis]MCS4533361.1 YdgA family protein [Neisseria montereyensis]